MNTFTPLPLADILATQRKAHLADPYPSLQTRLDRIDRLIDAVIKYEDRICAAISEDYGRRSSFQSQLGDVVASITPLKHARKETAKWMKPVARKSNFPFNLMGGKSKIEYIPYGVVGNISPWNFPVSLALAPMAEIFAAGNRSMLKPSELTPATSDVLKDLVSENFDMEELTVVTGGADVAAEFSALPFDHLLFTGSTSIARLVSQAAAPNLVPLTLELGGKNPVIISPSANLELAVEKILWAKSSNGGQICLSSDQVFVPKELLGQFESLCLSAMKKLMPQGVSDPDYTSAITQRHADRQRDLLRDAKEKGAQIVPLLDDDGGQAPAPSLVINPDDSAQIANEEIFGAPMIVKSYEDLGAVIDYVNARPAPLAVYYFGTDKQEIDAVARKVKAGGMAVNELFAHHLQHNLPFGGVGASGMGAYHGYDGFKNFSHAKSIYQQTSIDVLKMMRPPYTEKMRNMVRSQIKK